MQENTFDLTLLNGANGFVIPGSIYEHLGYSVSSAGDINGDNISDLVLGAPSGTGGVSYVLFGSRNGFPGVFNLTNLNGSNGFTIPGIVTGQIGYSVSSAGDINGDGVSDLVLGDPWANLNSTTGTAPGASYVFFGQQLPLLTLDYAPNNCINL